MQDSLQLARNANVPTPPVREMAHWNCGRELLLVVIVVYALARGSEAAAADGKSLEREFGPAERTPPQALNLSPSFALPLDFSPPPAQREFSATEFSPHKYPNFGAAPPPRAPPPPEKPVRSAPPRYGSDWPIIVRTIACVWSRCGRPPAAHCRF